MALIQTKLCEKIDLNFVWAFQMRENKDENLSPVTQQPKKCFIKYRFISIN